MQDDGRALDKLYSNQTNAKEAHFGGTPIKSNIRQAGDVKIETPSRVLIVSTGERTNKREFLVVGYLLDAAGEIRQSVIIKNNLDEVIEIPSADFTRNYNIVKVYREGVTPDLIYLDGVPDKVVSGQHWVPKDKSVADPFNYVAKNAYASDESPDVVWEVQSVIDNMVTLHLIKQEDHEDGHRNNRDTGQILKISKIDLVTNYRLHSFGFFLSNDFFKFIENQTYVAPENRDKIYMMGSGKKGEYVKMDDMIGPKKSNHVKLEGF